MTLFLTSSPCVIGAPRVILNPANGFVERLQKALPKWPRVLLIAADPGNHDSVCRFGNEMARAFREFGFPMGAFFTLDGSNADEAPFLVACSDLIILMGGHVPTQNAFFRELSLRQLLEGYEGCVMGISAGTMNCADVVYAQPEEPGEAIDPDYEKFIPGLGLTEVNILPHYQQVKDYMLDGMRLYEDITYTDSMGHLFFALPDGSYYYQDEERAAFYGKIYRLENGIFEQLTSDEGCWNL